MGAGAKGAGVRSGQHESEQHKSEQHDARARAIGAITMLVAVRSAVEQALHRILDVSRRVDGISMRIALPPALFLAGCFVRAMEGEGGCQTEI